MEPRTKNIFEVLRRRAEARGEAREELLPRSASNEGPETPLSEAQRLAREAGVPYVDLVQFPPDENLLTALPEWTIRNFRVLPHSVSKGGEILVLCKNPYDALAEAEVRRFLPKALLGVAEPNALELEIEKALNLLGRVEKASKELEAYIDSPEEKTNEEAEGALIEMVNGLLREAILRRASDIHLEPSPTGVHVRLRIDGELRHHQTLERKFLDPVVSRLKYMAGLEGAEKRVPMDGQFTLPYQGKRHRMRLSTIPGIHGEGAVIRILPEAGEVPPLDDLGFLEDTLALYRGLLRKPYGLILVTGPTGSGKTTTLFASIREILGPNRKVITVEDPVEYELPGTLQVQVNPEVGRTFSRVLRSILRHDPDIIVVGEIRDKETAKIAVEASLTGHMVLATLHTNDATSAPARLLEMGVEPYLLEALLGVLAQRLVRRTCPQCAVPYTPPSPGKASLPPGKYVRGEGCSTCGYTGYYGRVAIHELFIPSPQTRTLLSKGVEASVIRDQAEREGMRSMLQDGLIKASSGITTVEEVLSKIHG